MSDRKPWAPDSWVKLILILSLASALTTLTSAMAWRALMSDVQISSNVMLEIFNSYLGLFGVVVGYVLGSRTKD